MNIISRKKAKSLGLKHYFTGKECHLGHISKRLAVNAYCCQCKKENWHKMTDSEREKQLERMKISYQKNDGKRSSRERSRKRRDDNPDKQAQYIKDWRESNKEKCRAYAREKMRRKRKTPEGRAEDFIRKCLNRCLKTGNKRSQEIIGYTREDLVARIEMQFSKGMSWNNHGEWHIDHITPLSEMIKSGCLSPSKINALDNLRPLWASENLSKGARLEV